MEDYPVTDANKKAASELKVRRARISACLKSADGEVLMEEARMLWDSFNPLDPDPATMGYNVGLQQVYKQLKEWHDMGEGDA